MRPLPTRKHQKEFVHQCGRRCIRIQLTSARHQHRPRHATEVAQHIRIDAMFCKTKWIRKPLPYFNVRMQNLLFAHSLIARNANRKFSISGTRRKISSVTRQPFTLRTHFGSRFFSRPSSRKSKLSGISFRFSRANSKSISMPSKFILITGTYASSTAF